MTVLGVMMSPNWEMLYGNKKPFYINDVNIPF